MEEGEENEVNSFLGWAANLGITDSPNNHSSSCLGRSLSVSHFPNTGGRGLAAVRDLVKGELILRVPRQALITTQTILMKDQKLSLAFERYPSLSSTQKLTIALLIEMSEGKSSLWFPYLKHLPRSYDILASFSQSETQALQVDEAIWAAEKAIGKAESEWKEAVLLMNDLKIKDKLRTWKAWLWASGTISSRTLHIPWDEAGCLCPVGDLFNYAAPGEELGDSEILNTCGDATISCHATATDEPDNEQYDTDSVRLTDGGYEKDIESYCFYAKRSYRKGEQVLLSYGTYTNLELLEHYGFILDRNPNDNAFIPLAPEIYRCCAWPTDSLYIHQNGKPSFALLSTLRLWATPCNQRKSVGHLASSGHLLSKENEICVMKWIAKNCHSILKHFQTTIKEDNLLLVIVDNMHSSLELPVEFEKLPSTIICEIQGFLNVPMGENGANLDLYKQSRKLMDRWKVAVQWRVRYKKVLVDCISYCIGRIDKFCV